jgi:hypothetical protein
MLFYEPVSGLRSWCLGSKGPFLASLLILLGNWVRIICRLALDFRIQPPILELAVDAEFHYILAALPPRCTPLPKLDTFLNSFSK